MQYLGHNIGRYILAITISHDHDLVRHYFSRFSFRFLFVVVLAGAGATFMLLMLSNDNGGSGGRQQQKVRNDGSTMRHVASVANVVENGDKNANVDKVASVVVDGENVKKVVNVENEQEDRNSSKIIDPELKEAMIRLGKITNLGAGPKTASVKPF